MGKSAARGGSFAEAIFAGQDSASQGAESGVAEAVLGAVGDHVLGVAGREQAVLVLHIFEARTEGTSREVSDRHHVSKPGVRDSEAVDLAGFDGARHRLKRFVERRHAIEFVDIIKVQPLKA